MRAYIPQEGGKRNPYLAGDKQLWCRCKQSTIAWERCEEFCSQGLCSNPCDQRPTKAQLKKLALDKLDHSVESYGFSGAMKQREASILPEDATLCFFSKSKNKRLKRCSYCPADCEGRKYRDCEHRRVATFLDESGIHNICVHEEATDKAIYTEDCRTSGHKRQYNSDRFCATCIARKMQRANKARSERKKKKRPLRRKHPTCSLLPKGQGEPGDRKPCPLGKSKEQMRREGCPHLDRFKISCLYPKRRVQIR